MHSISWNSQETKFDWNLMDFYLNKTKWLYVISVGEITQQEINPCSKILCSWR